MTTKEKQKKAFKYYCMGLNSKEIGKLLDISYRTVQGYITAGKWKQTTQLPNRLQTMIDLKAKGYSYSEISKRIGVSRSTVYNHLNKAKKDNK